MRPVATEDRSIKVLLVEDNLGDVRLIQEMLTQGKGTPFSLEHVERFSAGLERLHEGDVDVVLLDLSLPDSQGFETFVEMRGRAPHVPIVVLTGLDDEEFGVKAVQKGAQDYLVKGQVDSNLLVRAVRYAIEREAVEQALREAHDELGERLEERERIEEQLRMRAALDRVRVSVYQMKEPKGLSKVLDSLYEALKSIGMDFGGCSVQLVAEEEGCFRGYGLRPDGVYPARERPLVGSAVYEAWREKRPVYRRNLGEEDRYDEAALKVDAERSIRSLVDVPFSHGTIAINHVRPDAFSEDDIGVLGQFANVLSEAYTRFEDIRRIEESEKALRRRAALDRVRVSVYQMRETSDVQSVLVSLYSALRDVGIEFDNCSVQLVDEEEGRFQAYSVGPDRVDLRIAGGTLQGTAVYDAWREQRPVYREDLRERDRYGDRKNIRKAKRVRAVLDVPFSRGTIGINSLQASAFSEDDIGVLGQFANVLSEAYTRFEDIRRIEESEEKHRHLFEHLNDAAFVVDAETDIILDANERAEVLLKRTRDEIIGMCQYELYAPCEAERYRQMLAEHVAEDYPADYDGEIARSDGTTVPVMIGFTALMLGEKRLILGLFRDITQWKQAEDQIQQQSRLSAVGQLAAGIAHDFNNLLTGIIGYAQLIGMRGDIPEDAKADLKLIEKEGGRAAHLVRQILDFSRKSIIQKQRIDLVSFLKESIKFL